MLDATHGPGPGAPFGIAPPQRPFTREVNAAPGSLRVAWTTEPLLGSTVHPDCVEAVTGVAGLLEDLGHEVTERVPRLDGAAFARAFLHMVAAEVGAELDDAATLLGRKPRRRELEPLTWALGLVSRATSSREHANALRVLERAGGPSGASSPTATSWSPPPSPRRPRR